MIRKFPAWNSYWMNGIEIGYLNSSPFEAFTLPMMIQMTLRNPRNITMGIPIMMKHNGIARTIYSKIEIWKFRDDFPFWSIHWESSFLDNQQISGPIIPPKGKKNPANAERWHNIAQFLSDSDNSLISFMTTWFLIKDEFLFLLLHYQNFARRFRSAGNKPFGLALSILCWL